jgi:peroxiredoxin
MGLQQQLDAFKAEFAQTAPPDRPAHCDAKIEELRASFAQERAVGVGDPAPAFSLPDPQGQRVSLDDVLRTGPVVVTFYRGGWCLYCNIQLRAYQAVLPEITALGGRLVAISLQLPNGSLSTAEANALSFDVLSDGGNVVGRRFGLGWSLSEELRAALQSNNKALPGINGDDSWELPVPATYVIARDGCIALAEVEVDYRKRLEPAAILAPLRTLGAA